MYVHVELPIGGLTALPCYMQLQCKVHHPIGHENAPSKPKIHVTDPRKISKAENQRIATAYLQCKCQFVQDFSSMFSMVANCIDIINYITGIGNGSRELILLIHALTNNHRWNSFLNNSNRKTSFSRKVYLQEYW